MKLSLNAQLQSLSTLLALINFAPPEVVIKAEVKEKIGLAMDSFIEKQKAKNDEFSIITSSIHVVYMTLIIILLSYYF